MSGIIDSLFEFTLKESRLLQFFMVKGKLPDNLLKERSIKVAVRKLPIVEDITPLN